MRGQFTKEGGIDIEKALAYCVHRVQSGARTTMFRELRKVGEEITPERWMVLVRLWEKDDRTAYRLESGHWLEIGAYGDEREARIEPFADVPLDVASWWA